MIGWSITEEQHFAIHGIGGEISITIIVFILDYFQKNQMTKNCSKIPKNPIFRLFWDVFAQIWEKNEFSWKKRLCQFLNIPIIYHHSKNEKKIMTHS